MAKTVLIVDDEQEMAEALARVIERKGAKALIAATEEVATKLYKENAPDCVFLDLHLSETQGTEVLKKLREIDSNIKAYFMTGDQIFVERQSMEEIGAKGYLLKPIDVKELVKIIEGL